MSASMGSRCAMVIAGDFFHYPVGIFWFKIPVILLTVAIGVEAIMVTV